MGIVNTLDTPTRIRLAMTAFNLNQSDLADQMGVTRASVSSWLNRDADRRTAMSSSALETMAGVLHVSQDWIVGVSEEGGPNMDLALEEELKNELEHLPTHEQFLKLIKNNVNDEDDEYLPIGFDDCSLGYMGSKYDGNSIDYDYVNGEIVLKIDISKKTIRTLESLTDLAWPLIMAKRIDEISGRPSRRYQLMLINPPLINRDVYDKFSHQSKMIGIQVSIRDVADAKEIANLIADPLFEDGAKRWPQDFVDAVDKYRNQ